jgi:hypothetical protein
MDQQAELEKRIETVVKIMAALYDKAAAYTNLVIIAGYAAFFAVWGNMKGQLGKREMLYAALFMSISLIFFILWETIKMVITSITLKSLRKTVLEATPEHFNTKLVELNKAEARLHVKLMYFWFFVLAVTVGFGLLAGGILINGFLRELIYS